jgi:hypothetical protein
MAVTIIIITATATTTTTTIIITIIIDTYFCFGGKMNYFPQKLLPGCSSG